MNKKVLPKIEKVSEKPETPKRDKICFSCVLTPDWSISSIKEINGIMRVKLNAGEDKWFYAILESSLAEKLSGSWPETYEKIAMEVVWEDNFSKVANRKIPMWVPYIVALI